MKPTAPEICVEVLSPGNTGAEMREKRQLCFDAGAREVWVCGLDGTLRFFSRDAAAPMLASRSCPQFPKQIELD